MGGDTKSGRYDRIIIGAGLYGIYSALICGKRGEEVLVLEYDDSSFARATQINQARIHMGYHYPRSYATAAKSIRYFDRFCREFDFCVHSSFKQIYATSAAFSWTNAEQFRKFCSATKPHGSLSYMEEEAKTFEMPLILSLAVASSA